MTKKCAGCGAIFQTNSPSKEGYIDSSMIDDALICKRCFRIKNYGDYVNVDKNVKDYDLIFNEIKDKNKLILFLCDILTLDDSIKEINNFKGKVVLVITKKDLLPKSVKEEKLLNYIDKNYNINVVCKLFVSSVRNYNLDLLLNVINKNKTDSYVYLVGNTNAGKSTLINALIKSYSKEESNITTSLLPATTLNTIKIKLNDNLTLIDTPGIVSKNNYLYDINPKDVKKITAKAEIKPRTYQIKPNQSLIIDKYARIDYIGKEKNSFTLYLSNDIKVKRININTNNDLRGLNKYSFATKKDSDIVIKGLMFCKMVKEAKIDIYTKNNVDVYVRPNLI